MDPEDLNASVMKYVKAVLQLEKGLPPNGVVPILKEKVENMRAKVSSKHFLYSQRDEKMCYLYFFISNVDNIEMLLCLIREILGRLIFAVC